MMTQSNTEKLNGLLQRSQGIEDTILLALGSLGGKAVFSTSFSKEDQVIFDVIARNNLPIEVFTLDTGRLFPETYSVWSRTIEKYKRPILSYFPNDHAVEAMTTEFGPNLFYESVALRKKCCHIRKVEPLNRALEGSNIWFNGIRAIHSENRAAMNFVEWDATRNLYKVQPLFHWTDEMVDHYIDRYHVPYNKLHDKGFMSIGCAPCTRAVAPGENARAGRWWWEDASKKECGLHAERNSN
jgi:phosphoadenosine phosphosulfate reductase